MLDSDDSALFLSHHGRRVRAAMRLLDSRAEAEDLVQDLYLRVLDGAADDSVKDGANGILEEQAWLTTVLKNLAIDRLRRRDWMRNWLGQASAEVPSAASSPEDQAALAQHADDALLRLALQLDPGDGAALLLREVFEASYREIAQASGKSEAACRQQVHRALLRLRQALDKDRAAPAQPETEDADSAACRQTWQTWQLYRQALAARDMQPLWAILRETPAPASSGLAALAGNAVHGGVAAPKLICRMMQVGGRLSLVLSLGGRFICVLPLGAGAASGSATGPVAHQPAGAEA